MTALYDIISIIPFSLLSVILFGTYAGIPENSIFGYSLCTVFSLWIIYLRYMKRKNRLRSIGIVSVFIIGLTIAAGKEYRQLFVSEYMWVIWVVCFSVGALIAGFFMTRDIRIKRLAVAALLTYCITGIVLSWKLSKEAVALICFILLVQIAEEIQRRWKKSGCSDVKEHITRISPFLLMLCIAVYFLPAPNEPFDWQFAKEIYYYNASRINRLYGYFTHLSDDYGNIGFSDNGSFLGGINDNDEEVLIVSVGNTSINELKLVGCISGNFTGREWVFDTGKESCSRLTDTIETSCAVNKYTDAPNSDLLLKTDIHCDTLFYNTRYIFAPSKIRLEATKKRTPGIKDKNGSIVSDKRFSYKDEYRVSCSVFNNSAPELASFLDNASPITEAEWKKSAKEENALDVNGYSFEDYQQYRSDIYAAYCHTDGVSDKVAEILDEIERNSSGRYEAMKILEAYLGNMEYSTDCGSLPKSVSDGKTFLDHFLLNSRKGYCMHYATAFVLMANEMGIPCRYVQGYTVKKGSDGKMTVRQSNAHAWPEVYFDNVGWIAFEPTPGYSDTGWAVRSDDTYDVEKNNVSELYQKQKIIAEKTEENTSDMEENEETAAIDPLIFVIPSAAVISFLLLFYMISNIISRKKYSRMSCRDKFRYLTQQNLRFLGYLGFRIENEETLTEFTRRVIDSDRTDIKDHLGFIPIYEAVLYSDRKISEKDILSAEKIYNDLFSLVKNEKIRYRLILLLMKK